MAIQTLLAVLNLTIASSPSMMIFATSDQADSNSKGDDSSDECYDSGNTRDVCESATDAL